MLKKQQYDSALSRDSFLFSLILFKPLQNHFEEIAAGVVVVNTPDKYSQHFLWAESVKCPAHAVFAKSISRHVHVTSLNLLAQVVKTIR